MNDGTRYSEPYAMRNIKDARRHRAKETGTTIEGLSLSNVMGTKGGGAPADPAVLPDGSTRYARPKNVELEETEAEVKAQREGRSEFGRPGAGAAIRRSDGEIETALFGKIDGEKNGRQFERQTEAYKEKRARHRAEERVVLEEQEKRRSVERRRGRAVDPTVKTSLDLAPPPMSRKDGLRRREHTPENIHVTLDPVIHRDPALKASLDSQVRERQAQREREKAEKMETPHSIVDALTPYERAKPHGRPGPGEFNQGEFSSRPVLLQDPEETRRVRRDLEREMSLHRKRKKELRERKLREERAHAEHGPLPGNQESGGGRARRDKDGNVIARRKRLSNDLVARAAAAPALV